jgi:hypothetical protein
MYRDYKSMIASITSKHLRLEGVPNCVPFVLTEMPTVPEKTLKLATGKTRDQWCDVMSALDRKNN